MSRFKDHFSGHAARYRDYRPGYPAALFAWLASQTPRHALAWDCATGNGQAAVALAGHFAQVVATDASAQQIARAEGHARVDYRVATADNSGLAQRSVDLITVAQAAHWFDLPAFYREVERVARDGAVLALWCYGLARITPEVDALVEDYYQNTVGPYWPPERRHIETGYRTFEFPFPELAAPAFTMEADWSVQQLLGYLDTWSASRRCATMTGRDPIAALSPAIADAWGDMPTRKVQWPLSLRVGRVR